MIPAGSARFVLEQTEAVKALCRSPLTNLFASADVLGDWIGRGLLFHEKAGANAFFFKKDGDFFHLFYVSPSPDELGRGLEALSARPEVLTADVVIKAGSGSPDPGVFMDHGFHAYATLVRMCLTGRPAVREAGAPGGIRFASSGDAAVLRDILERHFDRYAEQIPSTEEIAADAGGNKIILMEKDGAIAGLVHFELAGLTSHLRRWFVDPGSRGRQVGSVLLNRYFALSPQATRFILWVLRTNENAIGRYRHYGYREDGLVDEIFVNREGMRHGG